MIAKVTDEQRRLVETHQGCVSLEGETEHYVLMRFELYRELLGIGSDAELQDSLRSIRAAWADVQAGRTRPLREALDELGRKHEVPG